MDAFNQQQSTTQQILNLHRLAKQIASKTKAPQPDDALVAATIKIQPNKPAGTSEYDYAKLKT